jgi:hypothetical protein
MKIRSIPTDTPPLLGFLEGVIGYRAISTHVPVGGGTGWSLAGVTHPDGKMQEHAVTIGWIP